MAIWWERWLVPWVPVAVGAGCWALMKGAPLEVAAGMTFGGLTALLVGWLMVPEERSTAPLRLSLYAGAALVGAGVLQIFWGLWSAGLPANPWRAALALPAALIAVHEGTGGVMRLVPWMAGCLVAFGVLFAASVGLGLLFGGRSAEKGRRRSESELFGKSRFMSARNMRRMSKHGGIILGAMTRGRSGELARYLLEGAMVTLAPPRTGKTALIIANLLACEEGGLWRGSTVLMDPRAELFMVTAKRRQEKGRNVVLVDPFGEVASLAEEFADWVSVPTTDSVQFNPLDFVRASDEGVGDVGMLMDGLLTPPSKQGADNSRHFYESARALLAGVMAWVKWMNGKPHAPANPFKVVRRFMTPSKQEEKLMRDQVAENPDFGWGLVKDAMERMKRVGAAEGGSNYSTIANQLDWLQRPELERSTHCSTFDPMALADGMTDLYLVVPDGKLEVARPWLRMWVAIANAVVERRLDHGGMTIVLDEMPKMGLLKPVMDSFTMAAGKGIRYWGFFHSISALDASWGRENREVILDLAEVVQVLAFPRANPEVAERFSKAIGHATFVNTSRSDSGTVAGGDVLRREQSAQEGTNRSLVKERLMTADDLMTLPADQQIVVTNSKTVGRDALRLFLTLYWERAELGKVAEANPYVLRKERERRAA